MNRYRSLSGFLPFSLAVAACIVLLKTMNWIPFAVQSGTLREFSSIEQVRSALHIGEVFVPAYFPQNIAWPPSRILGQDKPFAALLMEFKHSGRDEVIFILSQSRGGALSSRSDLEPGSIKETISYPMRGGTGTLTVGECGKGDICSMIAWQEQGYTINALMRSTPFELIKIVESLHS